MKESVLWVSQDITEKLGMDKILDGLNVFSYGNQDMTGGLNVNYDDTKPQGTNVYGGRTAKEIAIMFLKDRNFL
jgi:hypothetical protein